MATTFKQLANLSLGGGTGGTFSAISSSYTDLVLYLCIKQSSSDGEYVTIAFNSGSASGQMRNLMRYNGSGQVRENISQTSNFVPMPGQTYTNRPFGVAEIYIPSANSSTSFYRAMTQNMAFSATSSTATNAQMIDFSTKTSAVTTTISSITLTISNNTFQSGSFATLYGLTTS